MLQRIQTVFLSLIILLMVLFCIFPVWASSPGSDGMIYQLYALFLFKGPAEDPNAGSWIFWPYSISGILAVLVIIFAAIEIFSYKRRMKQVKFGALNSLLLAAILILSIWFANNGAGEWTTENPGNYSLGVFFPAAAIFLNLFANRFIRKDEELVRSMDRIR